MKGAVDACRFPEGEPGEGGLPFEVSGSDGV